MQITLHHYSHKRGTNFWHLEWCSKYRYRMMRKLENKNLVEATIRKAAHEHGITIYYLAVMPDHVHRLVTLPHGMTDSGAFHLLKGRSAYILFRVKEKFRLCYPQGHFWSPGKFFRSVGNVTSDVIRAYINDSHHGWHFPKQQSLSHF